MEIEFQVIPEKYHSQVKYIVEACESRNVPISPLVAYKTWQQESQSVEVDWLLLPQNKAELVDIIRSRIMKIKLGIE